MGRLYELENKWAVEARELSIKFYDERKEIFEIDYKDLDNFYLSVQEAMKVRRDKNVEFRAVMLILFKCYTLMKNYLKDK